MCGINLIISKEKTKLLDAIKCMEKAQIHRGPDNQKIKIIENKKKNNSIRISEIINT
jgi:asparagine synthetase B (glutamine-hydrolysing)